ncbi:hypothetical protein [Psychromicrobium lacuslunae]|uniref:hypothetical protein n=1 Tax=Psychromicrobium lacuslunae TaxID=1618207 RepID=UPI00069841F7|nr:hypothetical protein [Psychromicrobium lacuslunae]
MTEQRFDRRFLGFGIGFPWAVAFCFAAVALFLRRGVPEPMGLHWDGSDADLTISFPAFVVCTAIAIGVVGSLCGVLAGARLQRRWLRRVLMGLAVALSLFLATVGAAFLMGQQGLKTADGGTIDSIVLALGGGAALALGVIMMFVYQPTPLWTPRDDQALLEAQAALLGQPALSFWIIARSSSYVFLVMILLLLGSLLLLLSPWLALGLAVVVLFVMANLSARLEISSTSQPQRLLKLKIAGLLPVCTIPMERISSVEMTKIDLWRLGGPGWRRQPGKQRFIARSGYAVRVQLGADAELLVGVRNEAHAQEVLEYLQAIEGAA